MSSTELLGMQPTDSAYTQLSVRPAESDASANYAPAPHVSAQLYDVVSSPLSVGAPSQYDAISRADAARMQASNYDDMTQAL